MKKIAITILATIFAISVWASEFLHREGKYIYDGSGNEIILRGIGPGGWMLQEPYMLQVSASNQKDFRSKIEKLMGTSNTDEFYNAWLSNYIQKKDINSMAAWGFNSIRLPMHYNLFTLPIEKETVAGNNTWLETGFRLTDSLLSWCEANKIYLILDMHATPGGQGKDAAISDYDASLPSLWTLPANRLKLIALWKKLAERYKDKKWIGGYDLINEPNWDFENSGNVNGCNCNTNAPLLQMYKDLITEIRKIDTNHIIIVEGNCWGNRYNGMNSLATFDNNIVFSFHKYWSFNNYDAISGIIGMRNSLNVPIWCGESGENSNAWYTSAIQLFEKNKIGWAWWTYKKFESTSGTNSVIQTTDYKKLTNYIKNGGTAPTAAFTKSALMQMAENLKLENCITNYGVINAMFRQVKTTETKPYKNHKIPGFIYCTDYDLGRYKAAYSDIDTADMHVTVGGGSKPWNTGYTYRNDGVDIEACTDKDTSNGYNLGWTAAGEWMQYTINVDSTAVYKLILRYATLNLNTIIHFSIDDKNISGHLQLKTTGDWKKWATDTTDNIVLEKGIHKLKLHTDAEGCNLNYFKFEYSKTIDEMPFRIVSGSTNAEGTKIVLNLNKEFAIPLNANVSEFSVRVNRTPLTILTVTAGTSNSFIELVLNSKIYFGDTISLDYMGNSIRTEKYIALNEISNLYIFNSLPTSYTLPAKIEAEGYVTQSGLTTETCNEGGNDMGYSNAGDFLDYNISVKTTGTYKVEFRISALNPGGVIELQLLEGNKKSILGTFNVPGTGGWQNWQTISGSVTLHEGNYMLRYYIKSPEFNTNWIQFSNSTQAALIKDDELINLYPNPCNDYLTVQTFAGKYSLKITDFEGRVYSLNSQTSERFTVLNTEELSSGIYLLCFRNNENLFTKKFVVYR